MEIYTKVDNITSFKDFIGKKIKVSGTISNTPWQHIMAGDSAHPFSYYFDINDEQTVIYTKADIMCQTKRIEVYGSVIEIISGSEKTGSDYKECQILVECFKCL